MENNRNLKGKEEICVNFVNSICGNTVYIKGKPYDYKYRKHYIPVIEYNELLELAEKYDQKENYKEVVKSTSNSKNKNMENTNGNDFRKKLEVLINKYSMENGSNTPDHILAEFLTNALKNFDKAIIDRDKWYGNERKEKNLRIKRSIRI
ncbi:MAG: hypothetical protein ACOCVF_00795 [bacterium]